MTPSARHKPSLQTPSSQAGQQEPKKPQPVPLPDKNPEQVPDLQNDQKAGEPVSSQAAQPIAKAFAGTIVKVNDKFVLQAMTTNMKYELDNQEKAKAFEGKQVVVTGSLDTSNLLHVDTIELAK